METRTMKRQILDILEWHEDVNNMILYTKYESIVNDMSDLFLIKLKMIEEKMYEFYPEQYRGIILEEIDKLEKNI